MMASRTLWSPGTTPDALMLAYTVGDDREVDTRLLRWDILGSLGHVAGLRGGRIISVAEQRRMQKTLKAALRAVDRGELTIGKEHEDVHSAVELWLTAHSRGVGEQIHVGRSRNDQVVVDIRLCARDAALLLHSQMLALADVMLSFARTHKRVVWPGYTHQRIAMPSSAGLWAAAYADGLTDAADSIAGFWPRLDRSPLGSAAGYGVPLPLDREAAARALGFAGVDQVVTVTQNGRGMLEAQLLFWCVTAAHECGKLSSDVVLFTADEFGWLTLPPEFSTGSSIMPQKRNPDLFELTRARAATVEGDLATVLALKGKLGGGYHRDFQLLKAPLWRGLDCTSDMLTMLTAAIPHLGVNSARGASAMRNEVFATDEAIRRARSGATFRAAYRDVSAEVKRGMEMPVVSAAALMEQRGSTGAMGNIPFAAMQSRIRAALRWNSAQRKRIERALARLTAAR